VGTWDNFDKVTDFAEPLVALPSPAPGGLEKLMKVWEVIRDRNENGFCPYSQMVNSKWGPEKIRSSLADQKKYDEEAKRLEAAWKAEPDAKKKPKKPPKPKKPKGGDADVADWVEGERSWSRSKGRWASTCTPTVSQAVAMLYDKRSDPASAGVDDWYEPYLADGRRLPYRLSLLLNAGPKEWCPGWGTGKSVRFFNLAKRVDPKEIRRGDVVGIQWSGGGGHGVFVWDVHLNDAGEVDCFQMISNIGGYDNSTGPKCGGKGAGFTIGSPDDLVKAGILLKSGDDATWVDNSKLRVYKKAPGHEQIFIGKTDEYSAVCGWKALPGVKEGSIDLDTFKKDTPKTKVRIAYEGGKGGIAFMECARFHGITGVPSYATVKKPAATAAAPAGKGIAPKETSAAVAKDKNALANVPATPVEQDPASATEDQKWVEERLKMLWKVRRLDTDPGKPDELMDAKSKAALKEFQTSQGLPGKGVPDKKTREALKEAVAKARSEIAGFDAIVAGKGQMPVPK
jgi:peptidoglycan hydrolase-like protein with peptidoglycan-binding domain